MKKNVTKLLSFLLAAMLLLSLCACGGGEDKKEEGATSNRYDFGDYEVVFKSACIMANDMGEDSIVVYFDFTNNSDSAASYIWTVFEKLTQGDTELEPTFVLTNLETLNYIGETAVNEVEPGATLEVSSSYKLSNSTDKVKMTISDLFDNYTYDLTFDLSKLQRVEPESAAAEPEVSEEPENNQEAAAGNVVEDDPFLGWWAGDWYGWWGIRSASGDYEALDGAWWDACGVLEVGEPAEDSGYNATLTMWDEDGERTGTLIGEVEVTLSPYGVGEHGTMFSESGSFMDHVLEHADWIIDPAVEKFENLITLTGEYSGDEGSYSYAVILRPWGTLWDDMSEESLPYTYNSWYLPLLNSGAAMPDAIGQGVSADSGASNTPSVTEAPASAPTEAPTSAPTEVPAAAPSGKMVPFSIDGKTFNDAAFTLNFSLPEGVWDMETYKFPYDFKIHNCPDGDDVPWDTPFIWIQFYDNEAAMNTDVPNYENLSETEGRTIGGVAMQGRKYDRFGYKQMQQYYGVLPSGLAVSIRLVKVPDSLLPECYAILDTISFK